MEVLLLLLGRLRILDGVRPDVDGSLRSFTFGGCYVIVGEVHSQAPSAGGSELVSTSLLPRYRTRGTGVLERC